ncbi:MULTISPECIES: group-specific protein [Peribacillus]|uniref:group-specific protein n=1 Tax=Peribacillus TaxID=2675229 RepID=UPI0019129AA3|nr:group-specific protein [Peribacillus sp. TH24]MBK5446036.1 group-specific protein [Peribacillus sp. TH24]
MLNVQIDEVKFKKIYLDEIKEKMKEIDVELVFWDARELERRTCMSWNTIQKEFFFDPDFPKRKVGGKWYFPAKETRVFLLEWIERKSS